MCWGGMAQTGPRLKFRLVANPNEKHKKLWANSSHTIIIHLKLHYLKNSFCQGANQTPHPPNHSNATAKFQDISLQFRAYFKVALHDF